MGETFPDRTCSGGVLAGATRCSGPLDTTWTARNLNETRIVGSKQAPLTVRTHLTVSPAPQASHPPQSKLVEHAE